MKLHELRSPAGSRRERQRVGRGVGAGQGKTSGRGQKGQGARTMHLPVNFEGGQLPLAQRLPKLRGFHNRFRQEFAVVNVGKLNRFDKGSIVDGAALAALGLVAHPTDQIKVLGAGRLTTAVTVRVHRISASAQRQVERAGGRVELLGEPPAVKTRIPLVATPSPSAAPSADEGDADGGDGGDETEE